MTPQKLILFVIISFLNSFCLFSQYSFLSPDNASVSTSEGEKFLESREYHLAVKFFLSEYNTALAEKDKEDQIKNLFFLGEAYRGLQNNEKSLAYYKLALSLCDKSEYEQRAKLNNRIGLAVLTKGDNNLALKYIEEAYKLYKYVSDTAGMGLTLNNLGIVYKNLANNELAIYYLDKARKLSNENDVKNLANIYNNLGVSQMIVGSYENSLRSLQKGLICFEKSNDSIGMAGVYLNQGLAYGKIGQLSKSEELFRKSLEIVLKMNNYKLIADNYINLGHFFTENGQQQDACNYYKIALDYYKRAGFSKGIGLCYNNIGYVKLEINETDSSMFYFNAALDIFTRNNDFSEISNTYNSIGDLYLAKGLLSKAKESISYSLKIAEDKKLFDLMLSNYHKMAVINEKDGDFKSSVEFHKKFYNLKDSLFYNSSNSEKLSELLIQLETEKQLQEIELLKTEKEITNIRISKAREQRNIYMGAFIVVLILLAFVIIYFSKLRKAYKVLLSKNIEIVEKEEELSVLLENGEVSKKTFSKSLKYSSSPLLEEQKQFLIEKIHNLIENEKIYLKKELTIELLAEMLETNKTYLSQTINEYFGKNFSSFVNEYRVNEARKLLTSKEGQKYSIEGIAMEVGFNSRSAFLSAFKKCTGVPPAYFQKNNAKKVLIGMN